MAAYLAETAATTVDLRRDDMTRCCGCGLCVRECAFLQQHGDPRRIVAQRQPGDPGADPFACDLCGLCAAVCPLGLDPAAYFLAERRRERRERGADRRSHAPLLGYERTGTSRLFTWYGLPQGCDTVFFPGCALPGTRPQAVATLYRQLRQNMPSLGIVLDCCLKPSHDLGRDTHFHHWFGELRDYLLAQGVCTILVACPNCQRVFETYGGALKVRTIYEVLAESDAWSCPEKSLCSGAVTVHDPCVIRGHQPTQDAVRTLLTRHGLSVSEMAHSGARTLCCGLGGGAGFVAPELAQRNVAQRLAEADGRRLVTYCAACAATFAAKAPTVHLVDLVLTPQAALAGKVKVARAPWTYLNRLSLKRTLKQRKDFAVTRERHISETPERTRPRLAKPLLLATLLLAVIVGAHLGGLTGYLQQERLQALIAGYGALAPAIYILIYALAPVFFLPGLPITLAGGLLFGPFWGVVYTISGATLGATLAFLVSRYLARDWVKAKLSGDKWARIDREVEEHGWKVVAAARLVPVLPFNLLNYAFGLTAIGLVPYLIATFLGMLPACIAFVVFSSSLPALIRGSVSPTALCGVVLIALVSLVPVVWRKFRPQRQTIE